ncbi:hypothetical protein H1R20_g15083, partial [Candolleomyces eurysporus]
MTNRSKTHTNPRRVAEISSMSQTAKIAENLAITARNGIKKVIHGLKAKGVSPANLTKYREGLEPKVNPDSDVKSLISLPEEEAPPAASDPTANFRQMVGKFTLAIQSSLQRPVSPSRELESTLAKKLKSACRPELDLDVSQALNPVMAKEVDMLDHAGFYSHLGLFTRDAIDFISFNANLIKMVRATIDVDGKVTTIRVIDADHKRIPKEHLLSHRDWYSASTAQLVWAQNVRKDDLWAKWLFAHFTWCLSTYGTQGADYDFTCILLVDITMRKKYHLQPFMFKPGMHKDLLNDIRQEYRLAQDKWTYVHKKLGIIPDSTLVPPSYPSGSLPSQFPSQPSFQVPQLPQPYPAYPSYQLPQSLHSFHSQPFHYFPYPQSQLPSIDPNPPLTLFSIPSSLLVPEATTRDKVRQAGGWHEVHDVQGCRTECNAREDKINYVQWKLKLCVMMLELCAV